MHTETFSTDSKIALAYLSTLPDPAQIHMPFHLLLSVINSMTVKCDKIERSNWPHVLVLCLCVCLFPGRICSCLTMFMLSDCIKLVWQADFLSLMHVK